ncbi:PREDICTED: facilitated trehalose transporter Tret1-like isoform X1 [Papilio xuthus]|uniref:Facilitated trehalose transporter Tret1-like isoform X1 n=2 Tax=Papilio xuthus TaxID=66420 RepID=A0AAJ7EFK2_PAPXU|nr:PREDICTED: facilitated trehalose transporter Tret1-like isoform X1 [Papilio xuthus]
MDPDSASELEKINKSANENGNCDIKDDYYSEERSPFRRQAIIVLGTFLLSLSAGATAGFSAVLIPQLQHDKGHKKYSTEMVSWVAAISSLALLFGNMISGYLMDRFGRRLSQMLLSLFYIGGWVTIAFANSIHLILFGRFITGFCQGWLGPLGPVFVGEISTPAYRGLFLASLSLSIASGVFMSHLFGTFLHWTHSALLCGTFPLVGCIILYYAPESPAWLASNNEIDKCIKSFQWYRGTSPAMKTELDKMILEQTKKVDKKRKIETLTTNLRKPEFWKPLCIMLIFFAITQLSGINVFCAYTTEIMEVLLGSKSNTYAAMLGIDILRCVALVTACIMLRRMGRRPIAIFSGTFTSLSLIILSIYLYLVEIRVIRHVKPLISLGLTATYIVVSNIGIAPLPWNMVGEVFATDTKGIGSGLSVMMTSISFFGTVKTAPAMFESIGHHGTYLFYGMSTLVGTIFLFFCLPETRGKTLLQIEERFRAEKKEKLKAAIDVTSV